VDVARPRQSKLPEATYALGAVSRLTGISPELLRAWERRYGVVEPLRTPGGTRRYRAADLERLRLVKAAVDAGNRIRDVAGLGLEELERRVAAAQGGAPAAQLDGILASLERLDGPAVQRLLSLQLSALGPERFAKAVVEPLVREIGERWADERMCIASEHLASNVLRTLLGSALQPTARSLRGPTIVFATPSGERHELGLQMAALCALAAGANALFLGADLPVDEILGAVERTQASALALSLVSLPVADARRAARALRGGLPAAVRLWVGGARSRDLGPLEGIEHIPGLDTLEQRVARLDFERRD
jgi:DNA-binding transcriptional MerR regulator